MPLNKLMKSLIKSLIFASLVTLTTTINAQLVIKKSVVCDLTEKVTAVIMGEQFKEKPVWAGTSKDGDNTTTFVIFANEKSGGWTILQIAEQWSCIVGTGDKFSLNSLESILKSTK